MEKKKAESFFFRILVSAVILTAASAVGFNDFLFWFNDCLITAVVILEVWICSCFAFMEYENEEERNRMLWRQWLRLVLFSFVASSLLQDSNPLSWLYLHYSCWGRAQSIAMSVLSAVLYRWLRERASSQTLNLPLYYVVCMLVFWESGCLPLFSVMPILACFMEPRNSRDRIWIKVCISVLYGIGCGGLSHHPRYQERCREIVYYKDGPAINIPDQERINWLGYKAAEIRSFFSRITDAFHTLTGVPHEEYHGYDAFVSRHDFGSLIQRFGWWWLIIQVQLVILVAVLLIRSDPGKENKSLNTAPKISPMALSLLPEEGRQFKLRTGY